MASATIIDLNDLVPEDKRVTLGDEVYTLPGDLPLETFLRLQQVANLESEGSDPAAGMSGLLDVLADLFLKRLESEGAGKPALEKRRAKVHGDLSNLGIKGVNTLLSRIYTDDLAGGEDEDEENPTPGKTKATTASEK